MSKISLTSWKLKFDFTLLEETHFYGLIWGRMTPTCNNMQYIVCLIVSKVIKNEQHGDSRKM